MRHADMDALPHAAVRAAILEKRSESGSVAAELRTLSVFGLDIFREHLLRGEQTVQRRRESGINGHLHDDFQDFFPCAAYMQGGDDRGRIKCQLAYSEGTTCGRRKLRGVLAVTPKNDVALERLFI